MSHRAFSFATVLVAGLGLGFALGWFRPLSTPDAAVGSLGVYCPGEGVEYIQLDKYPVAFQRLVDTFSGFDPAAAEVTKLLGKRLVSKYDYQCPGMAFLSAHSRGLVSIPSHPPPDDYCASGFLAANKAMDELFKLEAESGANVLTAEGLGVWNQAYYFFNARNFSTPLYGSANTTNVQQLQGFFLTIVQIDAVSTDLLAFYTNLVLTHTSILAYINGIDLASAYFTVPEGDRLNFTAFPPGTVVNGSRVAAYKSQLQASHAPWSDAIIAHVLERYAS